MNTKLHPATSLISRIDGIETPTVGRWSVLPGHTWTILRASPGLLTSEASAFGAAATGTVDIDRQPERCRLSLTIDSRRLTSDRPVLARTLAGRELRIDAVRVGDFATGGWDIAGTVASGDERTEFESFLDYRGVFRRRRDLAYAWFTMNVSVPAAVLGMPGRLIGQRRSLAMDIDVLATASESAAFAAA